MGEHQRGTDEEGPASIDVAGLWTYVWGARRRPFVHPLRTPSGDVLTRDAPDDHPWHHGLWFTIKYVDGDNFWEEYGDYGVLRHDGPPSVATGADGRTTLAGELDWIRPDRTTVALREHRRLEHVPLGDGAYALDVATRLAPAADCVLDRTPYTTWGGYGGLTLRGRADWHDTRLLLADGVAAATARGERAPWCDLSGPVGPDGAPAGVLVLDHPANPRHPTPWYASTRADTYGDEGWSNFCNAALLWHEPLAVAADRPLELRYRVVVHDGLWGADRCAAAWEAWLAEGTGTAGTPTA